MKIWILKTDLCNEYYILANNLKEVIEKYERICHKEDDEEIVEIKCLISGVIL